MEQAEAQKKQRKIMMLLVSIMVPLLVMLIPANEVFTVNIKIFFAVTLWGVMMFALDFVDNFIPALLLPFLYVLFKIAPMNVVFSPWSATIPWLVLGTFLLANILERIGLLKRIAYWCIIKTGGTYNGIIYGLILAGVLINIAKPGSVPVAMAALAYGVCKAFNLGKSKAACGIMIAAAIGTLVPGFFVFTPANLGVLFGSASALKPMSISFTEYFYQNIVFIPLVFILGFMITKVMKPEVEINGKDYFVKQQELLGKMSADEKKTLLILVVLVVFLLTSNIHKLNMAYGFVFLPALLFFPGFDVGRREDIQKVNYSFIIFIASCMTIGAVATKMGIGNLISQAVLPLMKDANTFVLIAVVWLLAVMLNFLLTPLAAMATLAVPLVQVAVDLGISPYPLMYTFFQGLDQVILPYEYALYLVFFSFGLIYLKDFMKVFAWKMLICGVYLLVVGVPYWILIGLL
ncbi:di-/tricarboxylate transporter [Desulfosporosinus orientis DSM 765]|uniref:Sodium-dependent dicarboxylate transporter SdcS n=1 Tax=Desulfosporosinus orientis (strain ATCC 19365 / DSM 765 / NCIMB 8382 / VKM B-1628 / Singapore I) TaxID=768706 RepID=G7WJ51_DESOD|nr:SLC13 family permease [Desulfosporosinus orientis]AET70363.1 di-/tricarboxylate transporter [Desulfosporosinus orientis DSM 765]